MAYGNLGTSTLNNGFTGYSAKGSSVTTTDGADARPYTLAKQQATLLVQESWEQELQMMSTIDDVLEQGMSDTEDITLGTATMPDAIGMSVTGGGENRRITMPVAYPMTGTPNSGAVSLLGNEKSLQQKGRVVYYNEYNDGLVRSKYGIEYNYQNAYGLFEMYTKALTKYWAETKGRWKRECLVEGYNSGLDSDNPGVASGTLPLYLNPNWITAGDASGATDSGSNPAVDDNGMPLWDGGGVDFEENVAEALIVGGDAFASATDYLGMLDKIDLYVNEVLQIEKLDDNTYVLMIPTPVYYKLTGITKAEDNNFGDWVTKVSDYADGTTAFKGEIGMFRDTMRIVPDGRWVGATVTGASGSRSLSFEYKMPGNEDNRDHSAYADGSNYVYQLGLILGKGAYIERKEKDLHFKYETQDYERFEGVGTFIECGYNLNFVIDDNGFAENRNSAVVAFNGVRM